MPKAAILVERRAGPCPLTVQKGDALLAAKIVSYLKDLQYLEFWWPVVITVNQNSTFRHFVRRTVEFASSEILERSPLTGSVRAFFGRAFGIQLRWLPPPKTITTKCLTPPPFAQTSDACRRLYVVHGQSPTWKCSATDRVLDASRCYSGLHIEVMRRPLQFMQRNICVALLSVTLIKFRAARVASTLFHSGYFIPGCETSFKASVLCSFFSSKT